MPGRERGAAPPRVVQATDPLAAVVAAGLAYSRRSSELAEPAPHPHVVVSTATAEPLTVELRLGDGEPVTVDPGRLAIDRNAAPVVARPSGPDDGRLTLAGTGPVRVATAGTSVVRYGAPRSGDGVTVRGLQRDAAAAESIRVDVGSFGHPAVAARVVLQLCAVGRNVVLEAADAEHVAAWLAPDLVEELIRPAPDGGDAVVRRLAWLRRGARLKTLAWMLHDRGLVWSGDTDWRPAIRDRGRPRVAVLLMTKRPALLADNLARLTGQRHVAVEVQVGLHGADRGALGTARRELDASGLPGGVVAVPTAVPLGAALNALGERASGRFLVKWDDDDRYGPDHLADLVAAHRWSGAALVGKYNEFTYLSGSDRTVWRRPEGAETRSTAIAGGTLSMHAEAFDAVGGFPPLPRAVDHHLRTAAADQGLDVFRTHGFGYALVRHQGSHTWQADERVFLRNATAELAGLPDVVGVGGAALVDGEERP